MPGTLNENLCDKVDARFSTLRMAFLNTPMPIYDLQSVDEYETHLELAQFVPISALVEYPEYPLDAPENVMLTEPDAGEFVTCVDEIETAS